MDAIVGTSDWVHRIRSEIASVAGFSTSVLISGASGTGKELIARAIHARSPRSNRRFIPVDCASITGPLFASHMFGHLKGAFTGATYSAVGCFRAAEGGTIFLDEIGELDLELQAKLLRCLQERVVMPVGSHDELPVDVRIVAATNRDLHQAVAAGQFREDLYYRLNVVSLQTESLHDRGDDVLILAEHFLERLAIENGMPRKRLSQAAAEQLLRYTWPGNVRELENVMERAILFSPSDEIGPEVLPEVAASETATVHDDLISIRPTTGDGRWLTAAEVECEHIVRTLEHTGYNQSAAARLLGIDRHQLRRRMAEYGLMAQSPRSTQLRRAA